ncbi:MAG: hypothetical protein M5U12_36165 [Verrucomicrobia bacterium]|nr:hypothetical protein [Verrucomicrobiota bacterium]
MTASALLLSLAWGGLWAWGAVPSPAPARPAITEGLLHYWPNLWDAHDEVTGREGVVMGLLPPTTPGHPDDARFDDETGYVQLPVAIPTDGAWTISCWMRADYDARWSGVALALISGVDCWWLQHRDPGLRDELGIVAHGAHPATGPGLVLPFDTWVHLALSKAASGRVTLWRDGVAEAVGDLLFPAGAALEWIVVGNDIKGDVQWTGHLQDLGVFDRVLAEADLRALRQAGRSGAVGQNRPPRQAAQQRTDALAWSTDWRQRPVSELSYRRYTAEDGLPANNVACLWQARDGALWVGTDAGLARFDGRRFRVVTADDTPEMARVGSSIQSLAEAPDGTIWAGVYGGLLRIRGVEVTGFTEGLTEGYVLQAVPEADGSLWVAGFRLDRYYRGPCRVRRFHPDTGQTTASVVVPGHVRRLVPTPEGLWMATEDPVQLLFWDRVSPTATVVARWSGTRLTALRDREPTPGRDLQWRGWRDPANTTRCVVEARVGPDGPSFHWVSPTHRQLTSVSRWPPRESPGLAGSGAGAVSRRGGVAREHRVSRPHPAIRA